MNAPLYTTEILRLAASLSAPRNIKPDGTAELRSPTCGSRVRTSVQVDTASRVTALTQQVHACAFGQASAALVEKGGAGRSPAEIHEAIDAVAGWLAGSDNEPAWPGISALAPARSRKSRHAAILLPFRSLAAALDDAAVRAGDPPAR